MVAIVTIRDWGSSRPEREAGACGMKLRLGDPESQLPVMKNTLISRIGIIWTLTRGSGEDEKSLVDYS